jgi:hypothetical protein
MNTVKAGQEQEIEALLRDTIENLKNVKPSTVASHLDKFFKDAAASEKAVHAVLIELEEHNLIIIDWARVSGWRLQERMPAVHAGVVFGRSKTGRKVPQELFARLTMEHEWNERGGFLTAK